MDLSLNIPYNEEKIKDIVGVLLQARQNTTITIIRNDGRINVVEGNVQRDGESFEKQVITLEKSLYSGQKGVLYKSVLAAVEKPLIEHVLERTSGNQLKAARILGMNRNTIRSKIKRLGIDTRNYKDDYVQAGKRDG